MWGWWGEVSRMNASRNPCCCGVSPHLCQPLHTGRVHCLLGCLHGQRCRYGRACDQSAHPGVSPNGIAGSTGTGNAAGRGTAGGRVCCAPRECSVRGVPRGEAEAAGLPAWRAIPKWVPDKGRSAARIVLCARMASNIMHCSLPCPVCCPLQGTAWGSLPAALASRGCQTCTIIKLHRSKYLQRLLGHA